MRHGITHSLIYQIHRPIRQHLHKICLYVVFIQFDSLRPGQHYFSNVGTGLSGLNQN